MSYLIKADVELQAIVPLKSLKKIGEQGLREVAIKQDTEFGFERHFDKDWVKMVKSFLYKGTK